MSKPITATYHSSANKDSFVRDTENGLTHTKEFPDDVKIADIVSYGVDLSEASKDYNWVLSHTSNQIIVEFASSENKEENCYVVDDCFVQSKIFPISITVAELFEYADELTKNDDKYNWFLHSINKWNAADFFGALDDFD